MAHPLTAEQRKQRASIAARARFHPDDPDLAAERQEVRTRRLEEHVRRVVDEAPPLSEEQRARIARALVAPAPQADTA